MKLFWDGIITASSPGVAAENSADGKIQPLERSVLAEGLQGILGTSGRKTAAGWRERADAHLIELDQEHKRRNQYGFEPTHDSRDVSTAVISA